LIGWAVLGAVAAGAVVAVRRIDRLTRAATPEGLARTAGSLLDGAQTFAAEVRRAAAEREAELRTGLLTDATGSDRDWRRAPARPPRVGADAGSGAVPSSSTDSVGSQVDDAGPQSRTRRPLPGGWQEGDELDPLYDF
jgi:hypothetical protein